MRHDDISQGKTDLCYPHVTPDNKFEHYHRLTRKAALPVSDLAPE
jgi:hypothetical protein